MAASGLLRSGQHDIRAWRLCRLGTGSTEIDDDHSVAVRVRLGSRIVLSVCRAERGNGLRLLDWRLGDLALPHAGLGLAVGEDLPEVSLHRLLAHLLLVALAKPLLGRRRER